MSIPLNGSTPLQYRIGTTDRTLGGAPITSGLIGQWTLSEGSGNVAFDGSQSANNGGWSGALAGTSGHYSAGYSTSFAGAFDGSSNFISHAHISAFDFGVGDFTISFWINPQGSWDNTTQGIIGQKTDDNSPGFQIYHDSGDGDQIRLRTGDSSGTSDAKSSAGTVPANKWTYCVIVRQAGVMTWYFNTVADVVVAGSQNIGGGSANFHIGYADTWGAYFSGFLADIRIFNRAIQASELSIAAAAGFVVLNQTNDKCSLSQNGMWVSSTFPAYLLEAWDATISGISGYRVGTSDRVIGSSANAPNGFVVINTTNNKVFQVAAGIWDDVTLTFNPTTLSNLLAAWNAA